MSLEAWHFTPDQNCQLETKSKQTATSLAAIAAALALCSLTTSVASAEAIEGFTEPYRTIHVASPESGIVSKLFVKEGAEVATGDKLAQLDSDVHESIVAIAKQRVDSQGRLEAARAEQEMHSRRYGKLLKLRGNGQAYQEEVDRAKSQLDMAEARVLAEREQLLLNQLEYEKSLLQLARRTVTAPAPGLVTELTKQPGEFVSPVSPELVTLVQLDPIYATFYVRRELATELKLKQEIKLSLPVVNMTAVGSVDYVSTVTDAESGTVLVKILIENSKGEYPSGERCIIRLNKSP